MKLFFRTLLTTIFFPWQVQTYAKNLRITTQDWPPYQISKGSQITGSATKTVECVLNKLQIPYNIEVLPWKTAQETVKAGKADAFYAAGITTERNTYAVPTEKIANYKWVWVLNKNSNLNYTNILNLSNIFKFISIIMKKASNVATNLQYYF